MTQDIFQIKANEKTSKIVRVEDVRLVNFALVDELGANGNCDYRNFFETSKSGESHKIMSVIQKIKHDSKLALSSVNLVFAKFLYDLSKIAQDEFFGMAVLILKMLHECLNIYGYMFIGKFGIQNKEIVVTFKQDGGNSNFCDFESCEFICIIFDFFVKQFIRNYLMSDDFEFNFVCNFLYAFNQWLLSNNLSKIETNFNSCLF